MTSNPFRRACLVALLAAVPLAQAESIASSASSTASSAASSASDSLRGSSNSSTPTTAQIEDGDYRIEAVATIADKPGFVRLTMQAGAQPAFLLDLPQRSFDAQGLERGHVLSARQRPYGLAFARAGATEPFFLVLADDWHGQLDPRKL